MKRRNFLVGTVAMAAAAPRALYAANEESFEITHSPEEWRAMLTDLEYEVMREMGTEPPHSSPLNEIKAEGDYLCKGCEQPLYPSRTKFESGTGWPSFWAPIDNAVATKLDPGFLGFRDRTEVHCNRCGSHMGHVFDDGPAPTGKRHCINGIAMIFRPNGTGETVSG